MCSSVLELKHNINLHFSLHKKICVLLFSVGSFVNELIKVQDLLLRAAKDPLTEPATNDLSHGTALLLRLLIFYSSQIPHSLHYCMGGVLLDNEVVVHEPHLRSSKLFTESEGPLSSSQDIANGVCRSSMNPIIIMSCHLKIHLNIAFTSDSQAVLSLRFS
jgi:hypothetical protein